MKYARRGYPTRLEVKFGDLRRTRWDLSLTGPPAGMNIPSISRPSDATSSYTPQKLSR
jgi:hypothetical protein